MREHADENLGGECEEYRLGESFVADKENDKALVQKRALSTSGGERTRLFKVIYCAPETRLTPL